MQAYKTKSKPLNSLAHKALPPVIRLWSSLSDSPFLPTLAFPPLQQRQRGLPPCLAKALITALYHTVLWFSDYTSTAYHECKLRKEQTFTHFYNMSPISLTPVQYLAHSRYSINTWTNADRWYNFIMFLLSVFSHLHHTKYAEQMVSLFMHAITVTQITSSRLPANKNLKWTKISTHSPGILSVIHCLHKTNLPMLILLRQFVFSACA